MKELEKNGKSYKEKRKKKMIDFFKNSSVAELTLLFGVFWLSLLKVPKYELNIWQLIAQTLGKAFNSSIKTEIENVKAYFDERIKEQSQSLKQEVEEVEKRLKDADNKRTAENSRYRILLFNDEIIRGVKHSKQHFDNILKMIEYYENHCEEYPNFENGICDKACDNIHRVYEKTLINNGFLDTSFKRKKRR